MTKILELHPKHDPDEIYREAYARIASQPPVDGWREFERAIPLSSLAGLGLGQEEEIQVSPLNQSRSESASSEHPDISLKSAFSQGSPLECDPSRLEQALQPHLPTEPKPQSFPRGEQE